MDTDFPFGFNDPALKKELLPVVDSVSDRMTHVAHLVGLVEVGVTANRKQDRRILFIWLTAGRKVFTKVYRLSLMPGDPLRRLAEAVTGRPLNRDEEWDIRVLQGKPFLIRVGDKGDVLSVTVPPPGRGYPPSIITPFLWAACDEVPTTAEELRELARTDYRAYLRTPHWQRLRAAKLKEAGYRCQVSNSPDGLEVHHRTYERLGCELLADLTVLCNKCHSRHHNKPPPS